MGAVRHEAYLALEESLTTRLFRTWERESSDQLRQIWAAANAGHYDLAVRLANGIDLSSLVEKNRTYIEYIANAALLYGASRATEDVRTTQIMDGHAAEGRDKALALFEQSIITNVEEALRRLLLEELASHETANPNVGFAPSEGLYVKKYSPDQPRDDHGMWTAGTGMHFNEQTKEWHHPDRKLSEQDQQRLKDLRTPPAWKDVHLNPDRNGALQAIGKDAKGRTQYLYSAAHSEKAAAEKFARLKEFNDKVPHIRATSLRDMQDTTKSREQRDTAAVVHLIAKTGFRIGSNADTKTKHTAYGASTLQGQHVKVNGDKVVFGFTGKKGVRINKTVTDAHFAGYLANNQYTKGRPLFNTDENQVRSYFHGLAGDHFKVKDLRTWHGTAKALSTLDKLKAPNNEKEYKKLRSTVGKAVATHLGNTPAVALASYIDPAVFKPWSEKWPVKKDDDTAYFDSLMAEYFDTRQYDETLRDWRHVPETAQDPDDNARDEYLIQKFNPYHDEHGRFSTGDGDVFAGTEYNPIDKKLIDYKPDRPLGDPSQVTRMDTLDPGAAIVSYSNVPFFKTLNSLQGSNPVKDPIEDYVAKRKALFDAQPTTKIPMKDLIYTQTVVNTAKIKSGADWVKGGSKGGKHKPIYVVRYDGDLYVMDGHHTIASRLLAGKHRVYANILDISKVRKFDLTQSFVSFREGINSEADSLLQLTSGLHTSRLSAYGFTVEAGLTGVTQYEISAQLDKRVCPLCEIMDGRVFDVADARDALDEMFAAAGSADDFKTLQPWPDQSKAGVDDFASLSDEELIARNWHVPPWHPMCRCLMVKAGDQSSGMENTRSYQEAFGRPIEDVLTLPAVEAAGLLADDITTVRDTLAGLAGAEAVAAWDKLLEDGYTDGELEEITATTRDELLAGNADFTSEEV